MDTFVESQRFRQKWLWIGLTVINLVILLGVSADPGQWPGLLVTLLVTVLIYSWRLDTRIDSTGVHFRVFPLLPWRTILWGNIHSATVCEYGFVGYGIRIGFEGWVYNVAGNKGLRVVYRNGRRITIGTQRPAELQLFLEQQYALKS